jgi:hypothetical protein
MVESEGSYSDIFYHEVDFLLGKKHEILPSGEARKFGRNETRTFETGPEGPEFED